MPNVESTNAQRVIKEDVTKIGEASTQPIYEVMQEIAGLSTDVKPTNVATGSVFFETDTTKIYIYDGENEEWNEVTCGSGGGGGGGDSDFSTAEVTLVISDDTAISIQTGAIIDNDELVGLYETQLYPDTYEVVTYKGHAYWQLMDYEGITDIQTSGDITFNDGSFDITGAGTITITKAQ